MGAVFVTNIPAPYRVAMYNDLRLVCDEMDKQFCVYFMNLTEPNRDWKLDEAIAFPHAQWNMRIFEFNGLYLRFSLRFVRSLLSAGDHLILAGSWNDLNVVAIVVLKRLGFIRHKLSFWTEANFLSNGARKTGWIKHFVRRFILNSADGFYLLPGEMSKRTLHKWGVETGGRVVELPNLPHRDFFRLSSAASVRSLSAPPKVLICARLDERTKGILRFLKCLGDERIVKVKIQVAGSGPSKEELVAWIAERRLNDHVHLLGSLGQEELMTFMSQADIFCLPSISDPSPLALVEACVAGKPILASEYCGNHFEVVDEGVNGYVFDPFSRESVTAAFDKLLSRHSDWSSMGRSSIQIASERFDRKRILANLAEVL